MSAGILFWQKCLSCIPCGVMVVKVIIIWFLAYLAKRQSCKPMCLVVNFNIHLFYVLTTFLTVKLNSPVFETFAKKSQNFKKKIS